MRGRAFVCALFVLSCTAGYGLAQEETATAGEEAEVAEAVTTTATGETTPKTTEERLAQLEEDVQQILRVLGRPGGRTSLSDYLKRELSNIQRKLDALDQDVGRNQNELRRLKSGR